MFGGMCGCVERGSRAAWWRGGSFETMSNNEVGLILPRTVFGLRGINFFVVLVHTSFDLPLLRSM